MLNINKYEFQVIKKALEKYSKVLTDGMSDKDFNMVNDEIKQSIIDAKETADKLVIKMDNELKTMQS